MHLHVELIKLKIAVETLLTDALVSKQLYITALHNANATDSCNYDLLGAS